MRQFYPFLLVALFLTSWGSAATRNYQANLTFSENAPVCYDASDANSKLVLGESFRAFVVQDTRATDARDTDPCKIDAAGQIVPAEGLTLDNFKWYTIEVPTYDGSSSQAQTWAKVTHAEGVPARKSNSVYHSLFLFIEDKEFPTVSGAQTYCYLVALDTRDEDGACTADPNLASAPVRPRRYALRKCIAVSVPSTSGFPELPGGGAKYVALGYSEDTSVDAVVDIPNEWKDVVAIQSWTKADGTPLTEEAALEAFLKPGMTAFASATDAEGSATFTLSATSEAEEITYYTLYTKAALTDATWLPFNAVMADKKTEMQEKGLDKYLKKDYTRCRLNGEGPLTIPLIPGDTGRFYLLRATGNE